VAPAEICKARSFLVPGSAVAPFLVQYTLVQGIQMQLINEI